MEKLICNSCNKPVNYRVEIKSNNHVAFCCDCGKFIKNIPQADPAMPFGKYKGRKISSMKTVEETNYLHWFLQNATVSESIKVAIRKLLNIKEN